MLKALLWKEWREQRGIAFAGAAVALMIPLIVVSVVSASGSPDLIGAVDVVPFLLGLLVWPLFAALVGATVHAEAGSAAAATFLLSRPVPRVLVWLIKVVIGAVALGFIVAVSFYAALRINFWAGGGGFRFPFSSDPFSWPPSHAVQAMAQGGLYVTFCGAIFLSTFFRRPVAAALGGIGIAIASQIIAIMAAGRISSGGLGVGVVVFLNTYTLGLSAVLLAASLQVFRTAGLRGVSNSRRQALRATIGVAVALPAVVVLAGFSSTRISAETAVVRFALPVPGTDMSVMTLSVNDFSGSSLWTMEPGGPMRRLTARLAAAREVSPDGEWLVYTSRLSAVGTRASRCELRTVRLDGKGDRRIYRAPDDACPGSAAFEPGGDRLATRSGGRLPGVLVTDLQGKGTRDIDLSGVLPAGPTYWWLDIDWVAPNLVLVEDWNGYWRVDTETGEITEIYRPAEEVTSSHVAQSSRWLIVREWPLSEDAAHWDDPASVPETTTLIDLVGGGARVIPPFCPPDGPEFPVAAFSTGGERVVYACRESRPYGEAWNRIDPDEFFHGALLSRRVDGDTGELLATFDGYVASLYPSPDGSRFVVRLGTPRVLANGKDRDRVRYRYVLLEADGSQRPLDVSPEWSMTRWFGNDRLVFQDRSSRGRSRPAAYLELHADSLELRPLQNTGRKQR